MTKRDDQRIAVAAAADKLLAGEISFVEFLNATPGDSDPEIDELVDMITHEPKRGGFLGASEQEWQDHRSQILQLIKRLKKCHGEL